MNRIATFKKLNTIENKHAFCADVINNQPANAIILLNILMFATAN